MNENKDVNITPKIYVPRTYTRILIDFLRTLCHPKTIASLVIRVLMAFLEYESFNFDVREKLPYMNVV